MFAPPLQREQSYQRMYPRLVLCDVTYQTGPRPVTFPRLAFPLLAHPPTYDADFTVEQSLLTSIAAQRDRDEQDAQQRERRRKELERKREQEDERRRKEEEDATAERKRKDDDDRRQADDARKRYEQEQEKLRNIAEAYKKQRAAVEAFSNKASPTSSTPSLPIAAPVDSAGRALASPAAVRSFCGITSVSDVSGAGLLLSLLDNDVDHAVNLFFSDDPPSIESAIERAAALQDRKRQHG